MNTDDTIALRPVAFVRNERDRPLDDYWRDLPSVIELADWLPAESLLELATFSHVEVLFHFDRVPLSKVCEGARHPRGNRDWPNAGIFAQRGKSRPNRLGLSRCRVVAVEGRQLRVLDLDAIDGTPVLDIKPWMAEFAPLGEVRQPAWSSELMTHYYDAASDDPRDP